MTTQQLLPARLALATGSLLLVLASVLCMSAAARADVLSHYQPQALEKAQRALVQGDPDRALLVLRNQRSILEHSRYVARSQSLSCRAYFQKRDFAAAEQACDTAVERGNPDDVWSHLNTRGAVHLARGRYEEAKADFRKAASLNPASREAKRNLQLARQMQHEQDRVAGLDQISML